jgi:hypothetical protein
LHRHFAGYDELLGAVCLAAVEELYATMVEEIARRTKVIGRSPGETSCLSLCSAVLDLFIVGARGLGLAALEQWQLAQMRADRRNQTPKSLPA